MVNVSGSYTTTDHGDYVEYVVSSSNTVQFTVQNGETWENVHINIENSGAAAQILTYTNTSNLHDNWTIRNLAVTGQQGQDAYLIAPACNTSGRFEHCYFGDGDNNYPGTPHSSDGLAWVPRQHNGHIEVHGCYASSWTDNGWYTSAPGYYTGTGTFEFTNCFTEKCHVALYRFGGATSPGTDRMENCWGYASSNDHRAVWAYNNANYVEIDSCDLSSDGTFAIKIQSGAKCKVINSSWDTQSFSGTYVDGGGNDRNPVKFVPSECPETASEAYTGQAGGETDDGSDRYDPLDPVDPSPYKHTMVFRNDALENTSDGTNPRYHFVASGEIKWTGDYSTRTGTGDDVNWQENTDEWHAKGDVGYREAYRFNGELEAIWTHDIIDTEINGNYLDTTEMSDPGDSSPPADDSTGGSTPVDDSLDPDGRKQGSVWFRQDIE